MGDAGPSADELVEALEEGRPAALGRLISLVERGGEDARAVGRAVFGKGGRASTLGITGAPGAGKSTLTARLITSLRAQGSRVGVLAIDPSSPFTGGALLGDRVRMVAQSVDEGVFIRSMATRGSLGGLATAALEAVRVLDTAGFDRILLETVGVGQIEIDVAGVADTTLVVLNPGWGDDVQVAKAGLLEVADIFAVNKADRGGARETRRQLRDMLRLRGSDDGAWIPPIVETSATEGTGIDELLGRADAHLEWLGENGRLAERRAAQLWSQVERLVSLALLARSRELTQTQDDLQRRVIAGEVDPWTAAERIVDAAIGGRSARESGR